MKNFFAVVFSLSFLVFSLANVQLANAATNPPAPTTCPPGQYCLSVPIPTKEETVTQIKSPGEYVGIIYRFSLGIGALLAVALIVFGGIEYTVSAGNVSKQGEAKDRILNAIYGLALLMGAVLILYTINPGLLNLKLPTIEPPPQNNNSGNNNFHNYQQARSDQLEARKQVEVARTAIGEWSKKYNMRAFVKESRFYDLNDSLPDVWDALIKVNKLTPQEIYNLQLELAKLRLEYYQAGQRDWEATLVREIATLRSIPKPSEGLLETVSRATGAWNAVEFISGTEINNLSVQIYQQQVKKVDEATAGVAAAKKNTESAQGTLNALIGPQGPQQ